MALHFTAVLAGHRNGKQSCARNIAWQAMSTCATERAARLAHQLLPRLSHMPASCRAYTLRVARHTRCLCQLVAGLHATCCSSTAAATVHTVDTYTAHTYLRRWYSGLQYLCQSQSPIPNILPYLCLQHLTQCVPQVRVLFVILSSSSTCLAACRMLPPSEPAPCTSSAHAK